MRKNSRETINGFTLIEISVIVFFIAIGIFVAKHFGNKFGHFGYILGFIGDILITFLSVGLLCALEDFFFGGIPRLPYCRNNKCKGVSNYRIEKIKNGTIVHKCKCGDLYIKKGRSFLEIDDDGNEKKYLIWIPFRGWKKDISHN